MPSSHGCSQMMSIFQVQGARPIGYTQRVNLWWSQLRAEWMVFLEAGQSSASSTSQESPSFVLRVQLWVGSSSLLCFMGIDAGHDLLPWWGVMVLACWARISSQSFSVTPCWNKLRYTSNSCTSVHDQSVRHGHGLKEIVNTDTLPHPCDGNMQCGLVSAWSWQWVYCPGWDFWLSQLCCLGSGWEILILWQGFCWYLLY